MKNAGRFDYNIYHLLNSFEGNTIRRQLFELRKSYYDYKNNVFLYNYSIWHRLIAMECISTMFYCGLITLDECTELRNQFDYLCRLYKTAQ